MSKSWFYLENYVYVNTIVPDKVLLYNMLNHKLLTYKNEKIFHLVKAQKSVENHGLVEIDLDELHHSDFELYNFIIQTREHFMSDCLPVSDKCKKPVLFQSEPMVLKEGHVYYNFSEEIIHNITELTFYINNSCTCHCEHCGEYQKQVSCCYKSNSSEELDIDSIITCLESLKEASLVQVNIMGGNILTYRRLPELVEKLNDFSFRKVYKINAKQLVSIKDLDFIWKYPKNMLEIICTDMLDLGKLKLTNVEPGSLQMRINVLVQSNEDLAKTETFIQTYPNDNHVLTPFYNGQNESFFQENVFVSEEELVCVSSKSIKRNSILNNNFYGKLVCFPNGDVYSNLNGTSLGNISKNSFAAMVYRELSEEDSWMKVRRKVEPCKHCLFASMCPPLSNYEQAMSKNNLCTVII